MTLSRLGKKLIIVTGTVLGFAVIFLVAFHLWFVRHAKDLLEETVERRSQGKVKLKVEKLRFNYFSRKMVIREAVFFTTDTLTAPSAYRFAVKEIRLRLKGLLPLVLDNKLLIDSLQLRSPDILVTTLRLAKDKPGKNSNDVSIPYEMGKIYHSIQDALEVLRVTKFRIDDGKFTLVNKAQPGQVPLRVSNIHILIDNLKVDTSQLSGQEKLLFSDNVVIRSEHQDILFPDGRHRLAFSGFRINLQSQLVEFDSCTIAANRTDSSMSSFHVFFDTLKLTRIDFDTLYRTEVIKADSVYCLNPKFELVAEAGKKKPGKKGIPRLENIVQQLTGNLLLGFVGVENADFNIRITKDGVPNTYTFSRNNFQMQGLSIDQDAAKPITVRSFDMAIRNYENFIKDSSYSIQFDSIRFRDDRIYLSNFLFNKLDRGKILNTFRMPRFQLEGLSWDDLVFDRKLRAKTAIMYEPDIDYTPSPNPAKKQTLFQSLGAVNEYMDLDQLDIVNGRIDLKLKHDLRVQLEKASLSVQSQSLLSSTRLAGIKNSLNNLYFETGNIRAGNTHLLLKRIRYTGESGKFAAGSILLKDETKKLEALLENVTVDKMVVDESNGNLFAEGINWEKGDLRISLAGPGQSQTKPGSVIELKSLQGSNTRFSGTISGYRISTQLDAVKLDELISRPGEKIVLTGFAANGNDLRLAEKEMELTAAEYHFTDQAMSAFKKVIYRNDNPGSKTTISVSEITAIPKLLRLMNGELALDAVHISDPLIEWENDYSGSAKTNALPRFPQTDISSIKINRPVIHYKDKNDKGNVSLHWNGKGEPGEIILEGLLSKRDKSTMLSAKKIGIRLADFNYTNRNGRTFQSGKMKIQAAFSDVLLEQKAGNGLSWTALANMISIRDFHFDSTGRKNGKLELTSADIGDLRISSETIDNIRELVAANAGFRLENLTGRFTNSVSRLTWNNAGYDRSKGMLIADSVSIRPSLSKDSFLTTKQFQTDYLQAGSGLLKIGPLDLDALLGDRMLLVSNAEIHDAYFYDYKDKRLPINPGIIKPLPVALLKKIPLNIRVDTIQFMNGHVRYTELNDKTKREGVIPVTRMSVTIQNVKNFNLLVTDSLVIQADGYLFDTYRTRLLVKESYADSSGGFLMRLQVGPGDLSVLNSTLVPLASVKLLSGKLDTLNMRVTGREYLARGEMNLFYENLKVQLLMDGNESKRTLKTRLLSFIANSFIVRSKNRSKTGNVFFIRHRDRSAMNYLLNITLNGIMESTGIKSNKKLLRRHRKESGKKKSPATGSE